MNNQDRLNHSLKCGLNTTTLEKFCDFAKENRASVQFELEATGVSEGRAVHTRAETGPYTLGGQRIDRMAANTSTISVLTRRWKKRWALLLQPTALKQRKLCSQR